MTVLVSVSQLQRVSLKLSLPLGSAWLLRQISQYCSLFESKIRFGPWNKDWTWTSILYLPLWLQRCQIVHCLGSTLQYEFLPDLEASYILGIKIDFLLLLVMEEYRRIVQFWLFSNLLRSIVWITSGLLTIFQIVARNLAASFPVALHWLAFMQEEVV